MNFVSQYQWLSFVQCKLPSIPIAKIKKSNVDIYIYIYIYIFDAYVSAYVNLNKWEINLSKQFNKLSNLVNLYGNFWYMQCPPIIEENDWESSCYWFLWPSMGSFLNGDVYIQFLFHFQDLHLIHFKKKNYVWFKFKHYIHHHVQRKVSQPSI